MITNNNDHKCFAEDIKVLFYFWSFVDFSLWKIMKRDTDTIEHLLLTGYLHLVNRNGHKDARFI